MNRKKDIEQLFRQHYAKMYNLARCILSDDDESKDVVSEVFAQILADDVVLVPESEEGYLMRSVRNRCLNLIAHKSVKERVAKLLLDDADVILTEDTDERLDHTDWHNLVFYRGLAKVVEKYVHKGDRLYVEGRIRYRSYDDKQGRRQYITEIYVDNMEMLSTRPATKEQ